MSGLSKNQYEEEHRQCKEMQKKKKSALERKKQKPFTAY